MNWDLSGPISSNLGQPWTIGVRYGQLGPVSASTGLLRTNLAKLSPIWFQPWLIVTNLRKSGSIKDNQGKSLPYKARQGLQEQLRSVNATLEQCGLIVANPGPTIFFVNSFISLLLLHTNIISGVRTNIPPKSQFGSCPLRPPSSRRQWTAWPAGSVCWGQVLCHHWGTRAPVPAIMLDYWLPAENSFMLDYSVMRRAGSLSLTKQILKKNHKETPIDRRGCSLLRVFICTKILTKSVWSVQNLNVSYFLSIDPNIRFKLPRNL